MPERGGRLVWVLHSAGAVAAGLVAVVVLSIVTDVLAGEAGWLPGPGKPVIDDRLFVLPTIYRSLYAVIGAAVAAWLAPSAPLKHALAFGVVGVLLNIGGGFVQQGIGPTWYPVALAALSLPCAWLGGALRERWA
jgi:hypothetical protein